MKKILALLLVLAMLVTLVACATPEPEVTPTPAATPTPAPDDGEEDPNGGDEVDGPIVLGMIASLSGAFQSWGEQWQRGFYMGLEYMTNGTNTVAGRTIETVWEDTTTVPDIARERTLALLDRGVDVVIGYTSTGDAMACLGLFEEFDTIAIVSPAAGDGIIMYPFWNENIFRSARTGAQDIYATMSGLIAQNPDPTGVTVGVFVPDSTWGHGLSDPFVAQAEAYGFEVTLIELVPPDATDFT
ncbi:MAG: ABC transporter substrate-binding protein, partial [Oscillospiraceae bacterium]|nr:ABC transporter substrate-binding protein [Oscillospiraceae bacterium]